MLKKLISCISTLKNLQALSISIEKYGYSVISGIGSIKDSFRLPYKSKEEARNIFAEFCQL